MKLRKKLKPQIELLEKNSGMDIYNDYLKKIYIIDHEEINFIKNKG